MAKADGSDKTDKSAILARRALFIASAMTGAGLAAAPPSRASAQPAPAPVPDCPPSPDPSPQAREEAKLHFTAGRQLFEEGRFADASVEFRRAYLLAPLSPLAFNVMAADIQRGAPADAFVFGERHIRCFGSDPRIEDALRGLEATMAVITVRLLDPHRVVLEVDGAQVPIATAQDGLRVTPGRHVVRITRDGESQTRQLEVTAGEKVELSFDPLPPPQPCLSPLPCLQPPPPPETKDTFIRLQGGIGAIAAIEPSDPPFAGGGPFALAEVGVQPASGFWIQAGIFGGAALADESLVGLAGSALDFEYRPVDVYGFGAGFSGGYLFASKSISENPALDPGPRLSESGFFGPVIIPASIIAGLFYMEARVPVWFSEIHTEDGRHLGVGAVAPHIVLGVGAPLLEKSTPEAMARR